MIRARALVVPLVLTLGCGGTSRILQPLTPTPDSAIPVTPPETSVAAAEVPWPEVTTTTLPSGLRVVVHEAPGEFEITMGLRIVGAGETGGRTESALPSLVGMMLRRGVLEEGSDSLYWPSAEVVEDATYVVGRDHAEIRYAVPAGRLDEAIAAIAAEAIYPAFDPRWFELERSQQLASVESHAAEPAERALLTLAAGAFGVESPIARSGWGTRAAVVAATPDRARAYHVAHYGPNRAVLVVSGPVRATDVVAAATRVFAAWPQVAGEPARLTTPLVPNAEREVFLDAPTDHALVLYGVPYRVGSESDRAAMEMLTLVYGGVFDSWSNLALREDDGSLYGASASPFGDDDQGLLVTSVSISLDDVERVVRRLEQVGARLGEGRVEEAELGLARRQQIASRIRAIASPEGELAMLAGAFGDAPGPDGDGYATYRARHERAIAITPAEIAEAAPRIFAPGDARLVVLGPEAAVRAAVARARAR